MTTTEAPTPAPRLLVPVLVVGLLLGVVAVLLWPAGEHRPTGSRPGPAVRASATARPEARAAAVLRDWDRRRAAAWAAGDARSLAALYVPGASAGRVDVAMLGEWAERGLAVDGLTTQLLAVTVRAHRPGRWVLDVRDRVTGARVEGAGAIERLPTAAAARRRVVLRRVHGAWRVASVRPARRAARR